MFHIFRSGTTYDLTYYNAQGTISGFTLVNFFQNLDNQWIHVVIVIDYPNKRGYGYRNGIQFDTTKTISGTPVFPSTNDEKYFGKFWTAPAFLTDGSLDEVRIYNRRLSAEEVAARYNSTRGRYQ